MAVGRYIKANMPEPGKSNHIRIELISTDRFEYPATPQEQPPILVHALSVFADMCILWGPDAAEKEFDEREHGVIATVDELPETVQAIVKELLSQLPRPQTP